MTACSWSCRSPAGAPDQGSPAPYPTSPGATGSQGLRSRDGQKAGASSRTGPPRPGQKPKSWRRRTSAGEGRLVDRAPVALPGYQRTAVGARCPAPPEDLDCTERLLTTRPRGNAAMNLRARLLHLMLALGCAGAADQAAWAAGWQSIGPYGGYVFRVARCAAEPSVVYALLFKGGVYRSGDGGRTWRDINRTLPAADYFDLAADPDDPNSAWVIDGSTQGPTHLYHTRDGGARWQRALTAPEGSFVVAAGRGGVVYVAGSNAFARSADQGRTWQSVTASLGPYTGALSIAVDYFRPGLLYAAIRGPAATGIW